MADLGFNEYSRRPFTAFTLEVNVVLMEIGM
ncbi:uncharacterized protein G2W53_034517 [Senna tora]|uniref:Uncharacterized protein n=1 Tax=Senna tora TaxID=362788 RepID=A0A834T3H0_9FABA|nr:uncharacterized protein G2W53_034517 [Senna tora]